VKEGQKKCPETCYSKIPDYAIYAKAAEALAEQLLRSLWANGSGS